MASFAAFLPLLHLTAGLVIDDALLKTELVRSMFEEILSNENCSAAWPNSINCHSWKVDEQEQMRYVMTNTIPPYTVEPYCPYGVGRGYCRGGDISCIPPGGTAPVNMSCPGDGMPSTGDVPVPQIQTYGFPTNPDPTNDTRPLNLYQLNPFQWDLDWTTGLEEIVDHTQDSSPFERVPFEEMDLFPSEHVEQRISKLELIEKIKPFMIPSATQLVNGKYNPAFQTVGVHLNGMQIKGPADADALNVDAGNISLPCGGHVTPPIGFGPMYHYHKASTCQQEMKNTTFHRGHSALVGYANDGFGIYGLYDLDDTEPVVDECNGHFGCLDRECTELGYHYHMKEYTWSGHGQFTPYWIGCLGPSKGKCNSTVSKTYDYGANWCGAGCGYEICVQPGTDKRRLQEYIASFGRPGWMEQFTVNPF